MMTDYVVMKTKSTLSVITVHMKVMIGKDYAMNVKDYGQNQKEI